MLGYAAFEIYLPLRLHFTGNYSYFKYDGRMKGLNTRYKKRNDKFYFEKVGDRYATKKSLLKFLIPQFLNNSNFNIVYAFDEDAVKIQRKWISDIKAMNYIFQEDVKYLLDKYDFNEMLDDRNGDHPPIFKEMLLSEINIHTFLIFHSVCDILNKWTNVNDVVYIEWKEKILNYSELVTPNKLEYRELLKTLINPK